MVARFAGVTPPGVPCAQTANQIVLHDPRTEATFSTGFLPELWLWWSLGTRLCVPTAAQRLRRRIPHSSASRTIWRRRDHHPRAPMNTPPDPAPRPNTGESTTVAAVNLRSRARRTWQRVFLHTDDGARPRQDGMDEGP
jgi:hypothetical protein